MKRNHCPIAFLAVLTVTTSATLLTSSTVQGQTAVDFREAIRTAEPALFTVKITPENRPADEQRGDGENDAAGNPKGPRFEFFDLDGRPLAPIAPGGGARGLADMRPLERTTAAFAVDDALLIAFVGSGVQSVSVMNRNGKTFEGKVISLDHVTGLAAIKMDAEPESTLVLSVAHTEPGMPVVAAWLDGVLKIDAGMISSRPASTGSGIGMTPGIDFGATNQMAGAPVIDANGIVVGTLVPGKSGGLVCVRAADIRRLVEAAGDQPRDLKRGLVGIQFEGGGALVLEVSPDSGADRAGIKAGDLIERVGEFNIRDAKDVVAAVASARAGDTIEIVVRREGEPLAIPVTLGEHPDQRIAQMLTDGGPFEMRQAFQLKDGKLVPMEIDPNRNPLPGGFGRFPMDDILKDLQRPGRPRTERSDIEKTLKELQRQMQKLNEKLQQQD